MHPYLSGVSVHGVYMHLVEAVPYGEGTFLQTFSKDSDLLVACVRLILFRETLFLTHRERGRIGP